MNDIRYKKEMDWFEKHRMNCDTLKDRYLECLESSPKTIKRDEIKCKNEIQKIILNRCLMYSDIESRIKI